MTRPVVLTRAPEDNAPLAAALRARGVPVVEIPCTRAVFLTPAFTPTHAAAMAFASRRAVEGFLRLPAASAQLHGMGGIRPLLGAVGPSTAEALALRGLEPDVVADPPTGQVLAAALAARLEPGAPVLVSRGEADGELVPALTAVGLTAISLVVYATEVPEIPPWEPCPVAAVFVAAPSTARALLTALPWLARVPFYTIGATTRAALSPLGVTRATPMGPRLPDQVDHLAKAAYREEPKESPMSRPLDTSRDLYERAQARLPGGVSSPVRAFRSVGGHPIYFREGRGARFWDEDGNAYVDYCLSWGPLILGHAHPKVIAAVQEAASHGLTWGACCRQEVEAADRILAAFPGFEMVRFVSTGTEAVMTAIRIARGATNRPLILKFAGGYHGHSDSLLVKAGSGLATFGTSSSLGVPPDIARNTLVCPFDDEDALDAIFAAHGADLAAAIVEPLPANDGLLEQRTAWNRKLRDLCTAHGALLIHDEVISGFRLRYGGYGDGIGVRADLVTLGKIIGGGMPVGAVVGPASLMRILAPLGGVYQAGTLSGNPVALSAGIATLDLLADGSAYAALEALGSTLDEALAREATSVPHLRWRRLGSIFWLHLAEGDVPRRPSDIAAEATARFNRLHGPMLDRGIYLAPSACEVAFLCTAHTPDDVRTLARAIGELAG